MASTVNIKQLASRLESSVSAERIEALQELQTASRTAPDAVGEIALRNVFELLRSQSSSEEYSEVLDLTSRLIKTRDREAALKNAKRILSEEGYVELLLDLLEHSDLMVGVMTSEILTELHANDREGLESQIQRCPDGMNKLLQRLPDSSREEVRNQAIVLIQQLTSRNEEMKKTVVFNEGFDILFRIISEEGGATEASLVTSDCLKICNNLVMGSETCQRLFYAMGTEWILRLADFFNPMILETMDISYNSLMNHESNQTACWFDESNRLSCAVLAIAILSNSLQYLNAKHQSVIAENAAQVLQSAIFWIGRNGPVELLVASLSLFDAVVAKNANIAHSLSAMFVKLTPNSKGKNISLDGEVATLQYGWKLLPTDERRCISLFALLAERYAVSCKPWRAPSTSIIQGDLGFQGGYDVLLNSDAESGSINPYLLLFHRIMSVDPMIPDTCVQYVLAPPPPPMGMGDDDDGFETAPAALESMRPVCSILLQNLVQYCEKLLSGHMQYSAGIGSNPVAMKNEIEGTERLFHLLTVVFMNASLLGRELSTAITTSHCTTSLDGQDLRLREIDAENKAILPFLLSAVGRAARLPGGFGFPLVKASMVWLATVVCGCERATHMVFEDPANLFVVDLATASSESAGVPAYVQVSACFFLACCLLALPAKSSDQEGASEGVSSSALKRKSFLTVIDSKIGLNRFTETLKKPLLTSRKPTTSVDNFFFIPDFRAFYETQVQNVKDVIFEMYSGVDGNTSGVEGLHLQMINLQKAKIQELEEKLRDLQGKAGSSETSTAEDLQRLKTILHEKEEELTAFQTASESLNLQLQESAQTLEHEVTMTDALRTEVKELQQALNERESAMQEMIASNESLLQQHREEADGWRLREERYEEEILSLKEGILKEASLRRSLEESVEQKDKKIFLLESELTELQEAHPSELAQLSEARHKITTLDEQAQQLRSEVTLWQRRCEQLQEELQLLSAQATVVSVANEINDEREARAKTLKEAIALLQSELDTKTKEWAIAVEENAELQEKLELAITPGHLAVSSEPSKNESDKSLAHHLLTKQLREHLSRLSQEIIDTNESIGDLPAGVGDDGDEEHEAADEADIDPDERLLVRAIHKLQNLRLAISFVAGECSQIYEGLNLPMEKLVGAEGTLGRCYEVVLELKDMYLQQGNQLCIDVDKLKASLEEYEQKFKELEEDKSSKLSSPDTKDSTSFSDSLEREVQRLKEKILELEGSVEDWQGHAEENAAEARHWRAYADELQHQVEASRHHHHQPATVEAAVVAVDGDVDKDNVQVSSTLEDLQATVLRLQEQLLEQDKVGHETLSSERSIWQQAEVLLKSEISRLQEQLSLLQAEGDKHRDSHSVLNHLRGKLAALEEELENERSRAHNEVANKETLIAQYQEDIEGKEKLLKSSQVEIVGLQDKLIRAQQELQRTEDTISQLTVATEQQQSSLQSELTSLREQLAAALAEATAVANTNDDAKFQLEAEIASLTATKLQLEAQVESVSAQLEAEKQLVLTLEGDISLAQVRIHGMSQESAGWQQEIHDLKAQILSIDAARHHLQEEAQGVLMAMKNQFDSIVHKTELQLATTSDSIVSLIDLKDRWSLLFSALERQHAETTKSLQHSLQMEVEKSKDLEQSIVVLEESNNEKIALLEQKNAHIMDLAGQLADKDERITHLMEVHEQERQARKELPPMPIFNNTVQLQDVEIRRLNTTVERLTKEIKQKEQENLTFKPLIMKRDGEIALLKDQLEMLQAASARLQKENDQLTLKVEDSDRQIRDKPVVLHNVAHSTVGRFAEYNVLPTSERMQVTEAMHLLHDFMLLTNEKHHIPDYFKTEINRDLTTQDLPDLVLALKRSLQEIIGKMDAEIDGFVKILAEKDKELAMFKAALVAANHSSRNGDSGSSSVNQSINNSVLMASPVRPSPPGSERRRLLRSAEKTPVKDESSFVTPLKTPSSREPKINSESRLASDWTGGSVDRLGGRRSVTVTPSAKEAARYHAELIRERKRLVVLQEEHADLLGLIAQQEVEISVFREKLHKLLGQDVETVEREARDNVEKQYGVYTNFRDMADA